MSERHPYVVLDVFTDRPLQGNPVAVFTEAGRIDQARMQALARELNLSETVAPDRARTTPGAAPGRFSVRSTGSPGRGRRGWRCGWR
jgi:predicted PhzF superfamily epimerase YddE/YHI9